MEPVAICVVCVCVCVRLPGASFAPMTAVMTLACSHAARGGGGATLRNRVTKAARTSD